MDGQPCVDDENQRGILIQSFSIGDPNTYNLFNKFDEPPYRVFCDIRLGRKSALKQIVSFKSIIDAQKPLTEGGDA